MLFGLVIFWVSVIPFLHMMGTLFYFHFFLIMACDGHFHFVRHLCTNSQLDDTCTRKMQSFLVIDINGEFFNFATDIYIYLSLKLI